MTYTKFTLEESKFTKQPAFTQLSYQLASHKEQMIKAFHTPRTPGPTGTSRIRLPPGVGAPFLRNTEQQSQKLPPVQ